MADIERLLIRWRLAGVLDAVAADRIRAWETEQKRPAGLRWQGIVALVLGAILLACGVTLFVSAHWDEIGPGSRYAILMGTVCVFHLAGAWTRNGYAALSTTFHAVGTVSTGAAIALVGQIFNIQDHWPAAILVWALAALAGWVLLHDEAQQTITFLLFPAWMFSELWFYSEHHSGQEVYLGRLVTVWAALYLTLFLGSRRRVVQGILFAAAAIAVVAGTAMMMQGWRSWGIEPIAIPFTVRLWSWVAIAVLPLFFSLFHLRKSLVAVAAAFMFSLVLPWTEHTWTEHPNLGNGVKISYTRSDPTLATHALVILFAVFIIWWGMRAASRAMVNVGIVYFAIAVAWFYFSDVFDKVGRSLGLIGLGVLFLAGGWALEKTRRGLLARIGQSDATFGEAQ